MNIKEKERGKEKDRRREGRRRIIIIIIIIIIIRVQVDRGAQLNIWLCLMPKAKKGGSRPSALHTASH